MKTIRFAHSLEISQLFLSSNTSPQGLSAQEVEKRQQENGYNELPEKEAINPIRLFWNQFKNLLVGILMMAAFISFFTEEVVDGVVILVVVLVNAIIGFLQEYKAENAINSLKKMIVPAAKVYRNGELISVHARELVVGDVIFIEEGDRIPADARLIEVQNFRTIEASLTGEPVPIYKHTEALVEKIIIAERKNMVFMGTFAAGGTAKAIITAIGVDTAIGQIATSLHDIKQEKSGFIKKTDHLAEQMAYISIGLSCFLFLIAFFVRDFSLVDAGMMTIAALVASIPEGLPAIISLVLAIGANNMAKRNAIIREFGATETLGEVSVIISDKTGTITQNILTVREIRLPSGEIINVTGEGLETKGNFLINTQQIITQEHKNLQILLKTALLSNNSQIRIENNVPISIGDPTEVALLAMAQKGTTYPIDYERINDLPFSSELKLRASIIKEGDSLQMLVVGAPEKLLILSNRVRFSDTEKDLTEPLFTTIKQQIEGMAAQAMRVIGIAIKEVENDRLDKESIKNLTFIGLTGMIDPPRPDVKEAIAQCHSAGIRVIMATGDHKATGAAIAREVGIIPHNMPIEEAVISEMELLSLSDEELRRTIQKVNVLARLSPATKMKIAQYLQSQHQVVAMTGDGVNDAPALRAADVGISMGIMGTDVARDASKVVLADDNFASIVKAIEEGRIVFRNARQSSYFLLSTNFAEIFTLIAAIALGFAAPLTATQILWLNLVTDGLTGIALGAERSQKDVLKSPPISHNEGILSKNVIPFLMINVLFMTVLGLAVFHHYEASEGIQKARTSLFALLAFAQLFNVYNMRSLTESVFEIGIFSNKYINWAVLVSALLVIGVIMIPYFEHIFDFADISLKELFILLGLSSLCLVGGEMYKGVRKWFN